MNNVCTAHICPALWVFYGALPVVRISMDSSLSSGGEFANSLKAKQEMGLF